MFCVPFPVSNTEYDLFVALEEINVSRIKQYDPAEIDIAKLANQAGAQGFTLRRVRIGYATADDLQKVIALVKDGKELEALLWLARGWKFRPQEGDTDAPYENLTMRNKA